MIDGDRQEGSLRGVAYSYPYPRPAVTCDVVAFTMRADDLAVLLVKRGGEPFKGRWALPGGFVNDNESLERAAARELAEETGLHGARLEQLATFGDPGRDPRGHTISIAYVTFLVAESKIKAGDDAGEVDWYPFRKLSLATPVPGTTGKPKRRKKGRENEKTVLAFDHGKILGRAYRRLLQCLDNPLGERAFDFLPSRFTLTELHHFYEVVSGRTLPDRAFKKRLLDYDLVVPASPAPGPKASGQLYRWNRASSK